MTGRGRSAATERGLRRTRVSRRNLHQGFADRARPLDRPSHAARNAHRRRSLFGHGAVSFPGRSVRNLAADQCRAGGRARCADGAPSATSTSCKAGQGEPEFVIGAPPARCVSCGLLLVLARAPPLMPARRPRIAPASREHRSLRRPVGLAPAWPVGRRARPSRRALGRAPGAAAAAVRARRSRSPRAPRRPGLRGAVELTSAAAAAMATAAQP
jgi:hypothetical protein